MDITPLIAKDKKSITGHDRAGFYVNGDYVSGSIIILPDQVQAIAIQTLKDLTLKLLQPVIDSKVEILLLGCGEVHLQLESDLTLSLAGVGITAEVMTTHAACRTYNILLAEGRNVAALLIKGNVNV